MPIQGISVVPKSKITLPASRGASSLLGQKQMTGDRKYGVDLEKNQIMKSKNQMDVAVKVHNKRLEVMSRMNIEKSKMGQPTLPLPTFNDTLRDEFGIGNETQPGSQSAQGAAGMLQNAPQVSRDQAIGARQTLSQGVAGKGRLGPQDRQIVESILKQFPMPKQMVNDRIPKVDELISTLDEYDNPKDAISDIESMDDDLLQMGLDITQADQEGKFQDAFRNKFGDTALQTLVERIAAKRGAGQ